MFYYDQNEGICKKQENMNPTGCPPSSKNIFATAADCARACSKGF